MHLLILVFALLVSNTAGSLASGLAGGLAFTATAVLRALAEVLCLDRCDSFHGCVSPFHVLYINKMHYTTSFR